MKQMNEAMIKGALSNLGYAPEKIEKVLVCLSGKDTKLEPVYVKQKDVADICGVSRQCVYNWVKDKTLKPVYISGIKRYRYEDVKRLGSHNAAI